MWKRILVPHDLSACAACALDLAVELARGDHPEIVLLHVSPLPVNLPADALLTPPGAKDPVRVDEFTTRGAREKLELLADPFRGPPVDLRTMAVATHEDVASEILRVARELAVDAIVLGTHGRTGLAHFLLGSVAERVIRAATVPVVTVRDPRPEAAPTREEAIAEDELAG